MLRKSQLRNLAQSTTHAQNGYLRSCTSSMMEPISEGPVSIDTILSMLLASVVIQRRVLEKMMEEMKAGSCQRPGATFLCTEKTCEGNLWKRKIPRSATVMNSIGRTPYKMAVF